MLIINILLNILIMLSIVVGHLLFKVRMVLYKYLLKINLAKDYPFKISMCILLKLIRVFPF